MEKYIRTAEHEMYIKDGIIYAAYVKNIIVDLEVSKRILEQRNKISEGRAYPILGNAKMVKYWTKEARDFHSSEEYGKLAKAVGLVFDSPVLSIFLNFYIRFHKTRFPIKAFTNEEEAVLWLEKFKN